MIHIRKGLNVPLAGDPEQVIDESKSVSKVALIGPDYIGMKPTMHVAEGDVVKQGQLLFEDKKTEGVLYTSPAAGTVTGVNRGAKRVFQSVEIEINGDDAVEFTSYGNTDLTTLSRDQVVDLLVESGLWTSLRQRPYSKVADPRTTPHSIFVTAIDTNPHCVDVELVISQAENDYLYGLQVLRHLTEGDLFLCKGPKGMFPGQDMEEFNTQVFDGVHPAGLPGTHIHFLDPVGEGKIVWYINYQDVIAIGRLFTTGKINPERIISIAGPVVNRPRLIRTRLGASITQLLEGELEGENYRQISGSVLSGRTASAPFDYLGRYHLQVSVLKEGNEREFLGWQKPGFDKFSVKKVFASAMFGNGRKYRMTTSTEGSERAMVPVGSYEQVMPLDMIPTFLLRSLIVNDTEQAQLLGALELDEEDLALCTYVCPGKYEYGPLLRQSLTKIEKEG